MAPIWYAHQLPYSRHHSPLINCSHKPTKQPSLSSASKLSFGCLKNSLYQSQTNQRAGFRILFFYWSAIWKWGHISKLKRWILSVKSFLSIWIWSVIVEKYTISNVKNFKTDIFVFIFIFHFLIMGNRVHRLGHSTAGYEWYISR